MLLGKGCHRLAVLVVLCIVTSAHSSVTVGDADRMFVTYPASVTIEAADLSFFNLNQIAELPNPQFKIVAQRFLNPTLSSSYSPQAINLKSLPAVPGTIFMVLTGFIYVSLVKDRKLWLTALAGLLWLSQISVTALPKLASHLYSKKQTEQSVRNLTSSCGFNDSSHLPCDVQGEYIGLFRYLAAIPASVLSFLPRIGVRGKLQQQRNTQYTILNTHNEIRTKQCVTLCSQNSKLKTQNSKLNIQLARGPPLA
jgi:hypothetical protein